VPTRYFPAASSHRSFKVHLRLSILWLLARYLRITRLARQRQFESLQRRYTTPPGREGGRPVTGSLLTQRPFSSDSDFDCT